MALIVQKYGGTSVGSIERIQAIADRVVRYRNEGGQVIVVVSAMSGETNRLAGLGSEISAKPGGAGNGRAAGFRRTGHRRLAQHGAFGPRLSGAIVLGGPDSDSYRW